MRNNESLDSSGIKTVFVMLSLTILSDLTTNLFKETSKYIQESRYFSTTGYRTSFGCQNSYNCFLPSGRFKSAFILMQKQQPSAKFILKCAVALVLLVFCWFCWVFLNLDDSVL